MKGEDFLKELNNLEESIIEEAREPILGKKKRVNGNIIKFAGLAACITIFTGAVIARSIGVNTKKEVYPAKENTSREELTKGTEMITEGKTKEPPAADIAKPIVWKNYDVNQDGVADTITVDIPADYESRMAGCTITDGNTKKVIYQTVFAPSYSNCGELYLCNGEGFLYFIEYRPLLYAGIGQYQYQVFLFNQESEKKILNENDIFFNLAEIDNYQENVDKLAGFYYEINDYLSQSMLLISTVDNKIQYSEEDNIISKQEEYKFLYECDFQYTQEDMYEKLNEYFVYRSELMETEKYITLLLHEDTLTPSGASFEIVNTSGIDGYSGETYHIEKYKENQWKMCDYISDNVGFQDMRWNVNDGISYSFAVDWSNIYGRLDNGSYRLVKDVSFSENISVETVCYFNIQESTNLSNVGDSETNIGDSETNAKTTAKTDSETDSAVIK